jgi:hypothetical protein
MDGKLRIIVTGIIAQHPKLGGVAWDYVQYPLGLARLGHDVFYFEDSGSWPYIVDPNERVPGSLPIAFDPAYHLDYLSGMMRRFGLEDRWAYRFPLKQRWYGLSDLKRQEVVATADLLINVSGLLQHPWDYRHVPRMAYIDSDPAFTQIGITLAGRALRNRAEAHDVFFSFGESFSDAMPKTSQQWRPTRQPIVLSEWRPAKPHRNVYTTVMNWTSYEPIEYQGKTYAQKDVELQRFVELPARVRPTVLELAMNHEPHPLWETRSRLPESVRELVSSHRDWTPRQLLEFMGWRVVDATEIGADLDSYRDYVESSKGEWSIAKNAYVVSQPGWFSCRSACYLAAGRPVIVQDTGFASVLPVGEGILPFRSLDEAAAAIEEVEAHYDRHAKAAREIAEAYFDSDRVLTRLIDEAMNCTKESATTDVPCLLQHRGGSPVNALIAGWFSFEQMGPTAGDLLTRDLVCDWLERAGHSYDTALADPFVGGVDWNTVDPGEYTHVVFVCGPFGNGWPVSEFLERFRGCRLVGLNLSMLDSLDAFNPFDLLLERDSSAATRPEMAFLAPSRVVPVVGVVVVHPQQEYKRGAMHRVANEAIERLVASRELAVVRIDTRLDANSSGLRTPGEVESLIARMDAVITTRLHGTVLALKNGVPALAIDPIAGGAKIRRQAETIGWPVLFTADNLSDALLRQALDYCLSGEARAKAWECSELAAHDAEKIRDQFLAFLADDCRRIAPLECDDLPLSMNRS